ncbi:MAG: hypothetical protein HUJ99_04060, partial [Bacteroidaceae bacterium]|nr:hypothetical protein [Bacteroidaceae bacterium]
MRNISLKSLGTGAIALFLAVCMPTAAWANVNETSSPESIQQRGRTIRVTVNDSQGPVIGANVLVKGTTNGSIT